MRSDEDISEAERIALEMPALSGDVVVFDANYQRIVRFARVESEDKWLGRHDYDRVYKYVVYVEAEEPVQAILAGGGTCLVLPIEVFQWAWPPVEARVLRHGVVVYDQGKPVGSNPGVPA